MQVVMNKCFLLNAEKIDEKNAKEAFRNDVTEPKARLLLITS